MGLELSSVSWSSLSSWSFSFISWDIESKLNDIKLLLQQYHRETILFRELMKRGTPTVVCSCLLLLVLPSLFSCAGRPHFPEGESSHIIANVPFHPQEMYQCGPASLSEVISFWGTGVSPEEIAEEIYSTSAKGTLTIDMILYGKKKGFNVSQYQGSFDDIKKNIDSGVPLVVMVDYGFLVYQKNHYMTVFGYDER